MSDTLKALSILAALMLGCGAIGNLLSEGLLYLNGLSLRSLTEQVDYDTTERIVIRLALMINHAAMFLVAGIIYLYYRYRHTAYSYIRLDRDPDLLNLLIWGVVILFSYPVVAWLTQVNSGIPLPPWALKGQESAFALLQSVLHMDTIVEFAITLVLVGLLPAVGEELIFRGIVQRHLVDRWQNPHVAIFVSSLLFGLTHMQLERLLPITFLGLLLGYSYYYSKRLIVPILLHLFNNSLQVVGLYSFQDKGMPDISEVPDISFSIVLPSLIFTFGALYIAKRHSVETYEL